MGTGAAAESESSLCGMPCFSFLRGIRIIYLTGGTTMGTGMDLSKEYGIVLEEWNHDIDHVYVMFHAQSRTELSKFINA